MRVKFIRPRTGGHGRRSVERTVNVVPSVGQAVQWNTDLCFTVEKVDWHFNHGFAKSNQVRRVPSGHPNVQVQELCPGSGTKPIPLAHKFPDGTALPRYRYYRGW